MVRQAWPRILRIMDLERKVSKFSCDIGSLQDLPPGNQRDARS